MKMTLNFVYLLFAALLGCKKDYQPITRIPSPPQFTCEFMLPDSLINWRIPLRKDTLRGIADNITYFNGAVTSFIHEDYGIYLTNRVADGKTISRLTGQNSKGFPDANYSIFHTTDDIIGVCPRFIQFVRREKGEEIDRILSPISTNFPQALYLFFRMAKYGDFLYSAFFGNQFTDSVSYLVRCNVKSKQFDSLTSFKRQDLFGYMGGAEPPALHLNANGDSTLIFKFRSVKVEPGINTSRCFLYAYNLTQRKVEWRIDSLDYDGSADPPIIEGDKCYVQGFGTIYCVDANTGQQIWKAWCGGRLPGGSTMISYNDRIAVVTSDGRFICVSKQDGSYIHNRKDVPGGWNNFDMASPSNAVELNGIMYLYGGGYLYGIDLDLGSVAMKYKSPHYCKRSAAIFGYGGIAADAATNQIFVEDQYFLMAVKAVR
jgi:hypothetical protein